MKNYRVFQKIVTPFMNLGFRIMYNVHVCGRENIPKGKAVLCCNHSGLSDPFLLLIGFSAKHDIASMAKKELFANKFVAWFIDGLGAFPVDRGSGDIGAIKKAIGALKDGRKLVIFPEGSRNNEGRAKDGAAMIAIKTNSEIVPVFISKNKSFRAKVDIIIGKPFIAKKDDDGGYIFATEKIIRSIYELEK